MAGEAAAGRAKAIEYYRKLSGLQFLVSVGLIVSASLGASFSGGQDGFGPPYFIGGFVAGALLFVGFLVSTTIQRKASNAESSEVVKRELACAISGSHILAMFTFMGCFIGFVFVGISGFCSGGRTCYYDEDSAGENKSVAIAILVLLIIAVGTVIFSIYITCTYASYFGVIIGNRNRHQMMVVNLNQQGTTGTGMPMSAMHQGQGNYTHPVVTIGTPGTTNNDAMVQQLQQQNQLLQQQLALQQQQLQLQQQQQQQSQFSPAAPPPPPSYSAVTDPAYPTNTWSQGPTAPPPAYPEK